MVPLYQSPQGASGLRSRDQGSWGRGRGLVDKGNVVEDRDITSLLQGSLVATHK